MLSEPELDAYTEQGFIVPGYRLPGPQIDAIRERYDALSARHSEFRDYCPALLAYDRWFLELARTPEILSMVRSVLGENIALWNMSFFAKPARTGSRTPWHQDGEYWPIEPLATCTVWIAIDDSTTQNGCLRVIPGSHKPGTLAAHHHNNADGLALSLELDAAEFDEQDAHDIELSSGQLSLHDVYLYHGSEPNRSDMARRGMTMRFMPTSSVYRHDKPLKNAVDGKLSMSRRTLFLLSGVDASGQNDFSDKD